MLVSAPICLFLLLRYFDGKEKVWKIKSDSPCSKWGVQVKESQFAGGTSQIGCPDMVRLLPHLISVVSVV